MMMISKEIQDQLLITDKEDDDEISIGFAYGEKETFGGLMIGCQIDEFGAVKIDVRSDKDKALSVFRFFCQKKSFIVDKFIDNFNLFGEFGKVKIYSITLTDFITNNNIVTVGIDFKSI